MNRRVQGDIGELSAMGWLTSKGALVWLPFTHSPHVDLMAEFEDGLVRVQVKTSTEFEIEPGPPLEAVIYSNGDLNRIASLTLGECQSGQMEQTVNLPAMPTQVRILPPPSSDPNECSAQPRKPASHQARCEAMRGGSRKSVTQRAASVTQLA